MLIVAAMGNRKPLKRVIDELLKLYVRINAEAEKKILADELTRMVPQTGNGDEGSPRSLAMDFRDESLVGNKSFTMNYREFDSPNGEAFTMIRWMLL